MGILSDQRDLLGADVTDTVQAVLHDAITCRRVPDRGQVAS
ncbi:hypothetical protein SCNU_00210 [Gordonia neofelifaecis NRRL B-59395]|uniref:Uncharacterized protein n=2 Tax=Gordonia TaxID=2053 RepID=F1YEC1_9ACTN|nr:hypothetical protein SCNU_00210 [Gordonia neofelifaecis NRRL B-59395]